MTQSNLVEQAKQGNPQAIAALMNRTLNPKGVTAIVERQGDRLAVMLESAQIPNQSVSVNFVETGLKSLGVAGIQAIDISGKQVGANAIAWSQTLDWMPSVTPPPPPIVPPPPPPPPLASARPTSPPIPPLKPADPGYDAGLSNAAANRFDPTFDSTDDDLAEMPTQDEFDFDEEYVKTDFPELSDDEDDDLLETPTVVEFPVSPNSVAPPVTPPEMPSSVSASPASTAPTATNPLGWLVVVLTAALSLGIIGYALWLALTTTSSVPPLETPAPTGSPTPSPQAASPSPQSDPYQEALAQGFQAATLAQSAQSIDDWNLVVSQWQQAIALLQQVPAGDPNYATAQEKIATYQGNLQIAQQRAASPVNNSGAAPSTTFTVEGNISCPARSAATPTVELSSLQFGQGNVFVGCITNATDQAIASVSIRYVEGAADQAIPSPSPDATASPGSSPSPSPSPPQTTPVNLTFSRLGPRETVPFQATLPVSADTTSITIMAIAWIAEGSTEAQQTDYAIVVNR